MINILCMIFLVFMVVLLTLLILFAIKNIIMSVFEDLPFPLLVFYMLLTSFGFVGLIGFIGLIKLLKAS